MFWEGNQQFNKNDVLSSPTMDFYNTGIGGSPAQVVEDVAFVPIKSAPLPPTCECLTGTPFYDEASGTCTCIPASDQTGIKGNGTGGVKPIKGEIPNFTRKTDNGQEYFFYNGKWHLNTQMSISPVPVQIPATQTEKIAQENSIFGFSTKQLLIGAVVIGGILYFSSGKEAK